MCSFKINKEGKMKINSLSPNFNGQLYLKNPEKWTADMQKAVENNKSIQKALENNDIIGKISSKKELFKPSYRSIHSKGDTIYKVNFIVRREPETFTEKFKDLFDNFGKKYTICKHYHSEDTVVDRISRMLIK